MSCSHRFAWQRQPDAAERVGKVLGEMLSIRRLNSRQSLVGPAQRQKQIKPNGVQAAKVHDYFAQTKLGVRRQKNTIPSRDEHEPNPNVNCPEKPQIYKLLRVECGRHDCIVDFLVGEVTGWDKNWVGSMVTLTAT